MNDKKDVSNDLEKLTGDQSKHQNNVKFKIKQEHILHKFTN